MKIYPEDKKTAVAKSIYNCLRGNKDHMTIEDIVELFNSWGMPDSVQAAV